MSRLLFTLLAAAGIVLSDAAAAQMNSPMNSPTSGASTRLSKEAYATTKADATAQYKLDREACASLAGNAKDICEAEARGKDRIALADADAAYENTPKARSKARVAHAQAAYDVAIEKCDDLAGNAKDVCVKEARAELVKGKANAKVDRVVGETREDAATKQAEARKEATEDKRDADYKLAIEKCDALAGQAKDACLGNAKSRYPKS